MNNGDVQRTIMLLALGYICSVLTFIYWAVR